MSDSLKTILFAYSSPTLHHGSPRVLTDIIGGLDRNQYQPLFLCPQKGELTDLLVSQGNEVIISGWRSIQKTNVFRFLFDVLYFYNLMRKQNVTLFHLNEIGWRDSVVVAAWLRRIPILFHLHVNYDGPIQNNWNLKLASSVIVVADVLKKVFNKTPSIHKKLVTVYNGLDIAKFQNGRNIRTKLGIPENAKVIGFVGQMAEAKGLKFLICAVKTIIEHHPDTMFLFVGRRVDNEAKLVPELISQAESQKVTHAIRFLEPRNDIPDVMKSLDILILPTLGEAFPKIILEAMGAEIPVIASAVGGIPEIIKHNENGLLIPPGNTQAIESALLNLLDNPSTCNRIAASGLRTVQNLFSLQNQLSKITGIYEKLLITY